MTFSLRVFACASALLLASALTPVAAQTTPAEAPTTTVQPTPAAQAKPDDAKVPEPGAAAGAKAGAHRFKLTFEPTKIEGMGLVRSKFEGEGIFQSILDGLADDVALPQDVPVTFKDCDVMNAYWNPEDRSLTMCWDLIALYNRGYEEIKGEEREFLAGADQDTVLTGTTTFILLHELGHGLVDLFDVPITGREEDAVDQFATLVLVGAGEDGKPVDQSVSRLPLLGAYFFKQIAAEPGDLGREIFSDEHALGQQRYYDVMCLVLGSDVDAYTPILTPGLALVAQAKEKNPDQFDDEKLTDWLTKTDDLNILPYERAVRCEDEYKKYDASWNYLVNTFMLPKKS